MNRASLLLEMYQAMYDKLGPSNWWPGETPFEVAVGAILTQNTNWKNVEKAILNLKSRQMLEPDKMFFMTDETMASLIRPAGYFRIKTRRLKNFLLFLHNECGLNISVLEKYNVDAVREKLLLVKGIGPETADSIILYALNKPSFVVDTYTQRLLNRHGIIHEDAGYDEIREMFMSNLPEDTYLYNEYHALLVRVAKKWCRKKQPQCADCPLERFLSDNAALHTP
ncbi:endonuclease III domain-containing protein [Desulfonatronovibrio magnus]|uniref:endonuclease III domain-containing protein n=1 Tax=Desulfonatronovibrio magnus TaxID=698827 RepID=UPI0005EB3C45|nr:endonuclease [Desulfonatronovibrio magnus]